MQSENFNVGWFKLAELVARKEKERALAMHRLLCHALDSAALISQLEGDLLLAFHDEKAFIAYSKAGELFEHEGKFEEAATLYDRCKKLDPADKGPYLRALLRIYNMLEDTIKIITVLNELGDILLTTDPHYFLSHVQQANLEMPAKTKVLLDFIEKIMQRKKILPSYVEEIINYLVTNNKNHKPILDHLQNTSELAYTHALKEIELYRQK